MAYAYWGRLLAVTGLALASPMLNANLGRLDNFEERTLAAHNRERASLGIPPLRWSDQLARDAAGWADHLAKVGYLVHSEDDPADPDPEGENLWAGTTGYYSVDNMVGLWVAEKKHYQAAMVPYNSKTGNFEDVGHYSQLAWRSTGKVGCAMAKGRSFEFMVCRYSEGGNVIGEKAF